MLINLPLHTRCAAGPSGGAGHESRGRRDVGCFPTTYPLCSRSQWQSRARVTGEKGCWLLPHYIPVVLSVPVAEQGPECRRGGEGMLAVSPLRTRCVAGPSGRAGPKVSSWGRRDVGRLPTTYPLCCRSQWQSRAQSVVVGEKGCWPSPPYVPVVLPVPVAEQGPECRRGGEGMLAVSPLRTRCVAGPSGRAGPRASSWGRRDVGRLPTTYPLCCRSQWQSRAQSVVMGEKGCWPSPHYVPVVLPVPVAEQGPKCRHGGEGMLAVSPLRTRCVAGPSGRAGPRALSWGRRDVGRLPPTYPLCCRSQWQSRAQSVVVGEKGRCMRSPASSWSTTVTSVSKRLCGARPSSSFARFGSPEKRTLCVTSRQRLLRLQRTPVLHHISLQRVTQAAVPRGTILNDVILVGHYPGQPIQQPIKMT